MEGRPVRAELAVLAATACLHVSAAVVALAVVLLPAFTPATRYLIWGLNADAINPPDYVSFTATGAAFQIGLAVFVAAAAIKVRHGAAYLASTGLFVAAVGMASTMLSFFGGGGILGVVAGYLGAFVGVRLNVRFATSEYLREFLSAHRRRALRVSFGVTVAVIVLWLIIGAIELVRGDGRAFTGALMPLITLGPATAVWWSVHWANTELETRRIWEPASPSP